MTAILRNAVFLVLVSLRLYGGALEDAADSLGDESFQRREQAEAQLKEAGFDALALVDPLLSSEDPEIALRAQRIRDWIVCGIDDRMPEELASDLPRFDALPPDRQTAVINGLAALTPPHLSGLANLHSRLFAMPLAEERRDQLLAVVEAAIRRATPPKNLKQFISWPLDVRTRALLINLAASGKTADDIKEVYTTWQKQQPDLRIYLDRAGVLLEVERLRTEWAKRSALAFVAEIKDEQSFQILVREFGAWMLGDPNLKIDELGETEAIAYLELTFESSTPGKAIPLLRKLRDRVPDLAQKLRPARSETLHALSLWESGEQANAAETLCAKGKEMRNGIELLGQMILDTDQVDFPEIIARISPQTTGTLQEIALREPISEIGLKHAINLSACLRAQGGRAYGEAFSCEAAEKLALDLWKNGRDDLCYRVMEEAFWNFDESQDWRLSYFPALAIAMGRLEDALATSEAVPAETSKRDLKMAYLYRAAGRTKEALDCSEKSPKSSIHQLLLIESRKWADLAEIGNAPRHTADWFACLNGDREEWRGDVPDPEKKSAYLLLMLDDHEALFSSALKSGGAGVSGAHYSKVLAGDLLLAKLQEKDIDTATLARSLQQSPAKSISTQKAGMDDHKILRPEIGDHTDPKTPDFGVLDGLEKARLLWAASEPDEARNQILAIVIRIILDERFRESSTNVSIQTGRSVTSGSSRPAELMMNGFLGMEVPREISLPATRIVSLLCLEPRGTYISKSLHEATAKFLAHQGLYEEACQAYHRFCSLGLDQKFHYNNIRTSAYLVELEIRRALESGHTAEAVEIYERHHRLLSYDAELRDHILAKLRTAGDTGNEQKLDLIITGFWEEKLREIPDAKAYRDALDHWKASFTNP